MTREEALKELAKNRNINTPFEVTTDEHTYGVNNFKEHDEQSVELTLVNDTTKVLNYEDIKFIISELTNPPHH